MTPKSRVARLKVDLSLAYIDIGTGPAVVFLHGAGLGASGWSNFKGNVPAFVAAGFRAILPDLPGFGHSSKPTDVLLTTQFFANCVIELLDQLGIARAAVVGNSMGGPVALQLALDRPDLVDRLILMGPGGIEEMETYMATPGNRVLFGMARLGRPLDIDDLRALLHLQVFDPASVTEETVRERAAVMATQPPEILANLRGVNLAARLGEIQCPILGFWGTDDQFNPASGAFKFLAACRDARFMLINRCGHWVMVEHADLFNRLTIDFLSEQGPPA